MSALLSYECTTYFVSTTSPIAVKWLRLFVQNINYEKHRIEKKRKSLSLLVTHNPKKTRSFTYHTE